MRSPRPLVTMLPKPTINLMPKYIFDLQYERRESIVVEADSLAEARELVENGDFFPEHIVNVESNYVELSEGEEVK